MGRIGAIIGPLLAGYLLNLGWRAATLFYAATAVMLIGAGAMAVMRRFYGGASREARQSATAPAQ